MEELLSRVDSRELTEWAAYEAVEGPIGLGRLDHLFGMLAATFANSNRTKRQKPYTADQFMPKWEAKAEASREMDGEEMLRAVRGINKAMGGGTGGNARRSAD